MQKITPFLWFDTEAEEAANLYTSLFPDSEIKNVVRYGEAGPGPQGDVMLVAFTLFGQEYRALNGGALFHFNESVSFQVNCDTQEEVDKYWNTLAEGGEEVRCGWLKDKFGLCWQITPKILGELLSGDDPERSGRVMKAMMEMVKLDIAGLKAAADGA